MAFRLPGLGGKPKPGVSYAPVHNGRPDPGEVVWTWVPYEEDPTRGKDRPVLVLAVGGGRIVALPLTSKDHDRDERQEARAGRLWMDVGTGDWDRQHRPSEVRLNRVLDLSAYDVRREGAALPREIFNEVLAAARPYLP
ncbi:MAG: PemK-like protein [Marmoricola sp.]|nr:PemK-like protein [Marmoricola sp.]